MLHPWMHKGPPCSAPRYFDLLAGLIINRASATESLFRGDHPTDKEQTRKPQMRIKVHTPAGEWRIYRFKPAKSSGGAISLMVMPDDLTRVLGPASLGWKPANVNAAESIEELSISTVELDLIYSALHFYGRSAHETTEISRFFIHTDQVDLHNGNKVVADGTKVFAQAISSQSIISRSIGDSRSHTSEGREGTTALRNGQHLIADMSEVQKSFVTIGGTKCELLGYVDRSRVKDDKPHLKVTSQGFFGLQDGGIVPTPIGIVKRNKQGCPVEGLKFDPDGPNIFPSALYLGEGQTLVPLGVEFEVRFHVTGQAEPKLIMPAYFDLQKRDDTTIPNMQMPKVQLVFHKGRWMYWNIATGHMLGRVVEAAADAKRARMEPKSRATILALLDMFFGRRKIRLMYTVDEG